MLARTDKLIACKHPALEKLTNQRTPSDVNEFSFELAYAVNRWELGDSQEDIPNFEHYRQTFTRKYCYPDRLIDESGYPTEQGIVLRRDANILILALVKWYNNHGAVLPKPDNPEQAATLEEVLIYGTISFKAIRLLNFLYRLKTVGESAKYADGIFRAEGINYQTTDLKLDVLTVGELPHITEYGLLNKLHTNPYWRRQFEQLMKYGFVSLTSMPKDQTGYGHGRAKLGISLSPWGTRFYELYLERFDPAVKKALEREREFQEYQREMGRQ